MRILHFLGALLLLHGVQAQPFHTVYGDDLIAHPSFAAAPDAFYLAHGADHELFKTDLDGQVLWSRRLEFNGTPVGIYRMAWINGVLLVAGGHAAQQNFIAAIDPNGQVLWANAANYGDINLPARIHAAGDGYLTVGHRDYPTGGGWTFDITLCRWGPDGALLWAKAIGDNTYDYFGWTSLVLAGGDILVAGERKGDDSSQPVLARFNADGDLLWMKLLTDQAAFFTYTTPTDLVATSDGNYALVATTYNTNFNFDAQLITFDGDGQALWARRMYQVGWTEVGGSIIEDEQQLLVNGQHSLGNETGGHVARFTLDGTAVDVKTLPYFRSPSASGYYTGLGQDLVAYAPDNYALAGECTSALGSPSWHGLTTFRFDVDPACAATTPYPFAYANITWLDSLITDASTATNITEAAVVLTSAAISASAVDLCLLLGVPAPATAPAPLALYPNPSTGTCRLVLQQPATAPVQVLDLAGRIVNVPISRTGAQDMELDLSALVPGMYTVRVQVEGAAYSMHLLRD